MKLPPKLFERLEKRKNSNSFRQLPAESNLINFYSNDYLGFASSINLFQKAGEILKETGLVGNGATGSRLLSGNNKLYKLAEERISEFHNAEAALIFNSGYDANISFFSAVPQRGDIILYDELVHASIRDGILMGSARSYKFRHNDLAHVRDLLRRSFQTNSGATVYIATESIFSMDGDTADLEGLANLSHEYAAYLVVDEAHASGVFGKNGEGLVQELALESKTFARIHTFGKAFGCHGAAVLGNYDLKDFLVNFARSFIYTTGLPPHSLATIISVYGYLKESPGVGEEINKLKFNVDHFRKNVLANDLQDHFIESYSAIQSCIIPGNTTVKAIALKLAAEGFEVKPILSPTVPQGKERLRFCIHSFNSLSEIEQVLKHLSIFIEQE